MSNNLSLSTGKQGVHISTQQFIIAAIKNQHLVEIVYDGGSRLIEPHCLGIATSMNTLIRAYQISGYSKTNKLGWKLFQLSRIKSLQIVERVFEVRSDYKRGDRAMKQILCEI